MWDFDDLDATEERFRAQLEEETSDTGSAEVLTQLARVEGLRGNFERCGQLLDEAGAVAGPSPVANVRIQLERGRMHRSSGDPQTALPLFEGAFVDAVGVGEYYLAGDAAHMAAIAVPDREAMEAWTQRGLNLGEQEPDAAYWAGPLLNNLAWACHDAGEHERALELFQRALEARERDPDNAEAIAFARYGVGVALRTLGRVEESVAMLEPAVAWAQGNGKPDAEYHGELAEGYAGLGREEQAREHVPLALALFEADPSSDAADERVVWLHQLVNGSADL